MKIVFNLNPPKDEESFLREAVDNAVFTKIWRFCLSCETLEVAVYGTLKQKTGWMFSNCRCGKITNEPLSCGPAE